MAGGTEICQSLTENFSIFTLFVLKLAFNFFFHLMSFAKCVFKPETLICFSYCIFVMGDEVCSAPIDHG